MSVDIATVLGMDLDRSGLVLIQALLTGVGAFLAALAAVGYQRRREIRDVRRDAYVQWLKAARNLARVPPETGPGATVHLPMSEAVTALNDRTIEIEILGSKRVTKEVAAFLDFVDSDAFETAMSKPFRSTGAAIAAFDELITPYRRKAVAAMRKDLRTGKSSVKA